jgi:hypothetical protein
VPRGAKHRDFISPWHNVLLCPLDTVNNHLPEGFLFRFECSLPVYTISISLLNQYLSFRSQSNGCQHTDVLTVMNGGGLRGSGDSIFCIVVVMTVQHSSPSGRSFCGFVCASLVPCFCLRHRLECWKTTERVKILSLISSSQLVRRNHKIILGRVTFPVDCSTRHFLELFFFFLECQQFAVVPRSKVFYNRTVKCWPSSLTI